MEKNAPVPHRIMTALDDPKVVAENKHRRKDLRFFLIPWLMFRATISFKDARHRPGYDKQTNSYNWGHEHQCTYTQLLYGRVDNVVLNRTKGFTDLVNWIHSKRSTIRSAKVFMRDGEGGPLDILCKEYYDGKWTDHFTPVFDGEHNEKILYYYTDTRQYGFPIVVLQENDPSKEDFTLKL